MNNNIFNERFVKAVEIAKECGELAREGFGGDAGVEIKDGRELVTKYDKMIEKRIKSFVKEHFPEDLFMGEEFDTNYDPLQSDTPVWIVDPIDGTNNFAHKIPIFAVSIGIFCCGEPIVGVVYNPITGELFSANKGEGAYLNGVRISVSENNTMANSIIATGFPYKRTCMEDSNIYELSRVLLSATGVRRMGAASIDICYVAAGKMDGYWESNLKPWDVAAGMAILNEAGGKVTNFTGEKYMIGERDFLISNGNIHNELLSCVKSRA